MYKCVGKKAAQLQGLLEEFAVYTVGVSLKEMHMLNKM